MTEPVDVENGEVHAALVSLAGGVDFDYDVKAWRAWSAKQRTRPVSVRCD